MKIRFGRSGRAAVTDVVAFVIVMVGALIMIRTLRLPTETLVASVYVTGVFAMWRSNAAILRSVGQHATSVGGSPQPDVPPA